MQKALPQVLPFDETIPAGQELCWDVQFPE
jgi:hypothetical protein